MLDYTYGLDKIYTRQEIEKAKISPSFEREYNLKYLGGIGNVFHTKDIDAALEKGKLYDPANPVAYVSQINGYRPCLWFVFIWYCGYSVRRRRSSDSTRRGIQKA